MLVLLGIDSGFLLGIVNGFLSLVWVSLWLCQQRERRWSASSQDLYHSILGRADSIVYVSRAYHRNCMLERNRFLVDHAAALLAVYNGERRGGTAATMRYARKMGREIIVIDPITRLISHGDIVPGPAHS
ncbi:SLOG family protein [Flintibacter muris]|uniref:SLOG family protein n=1 Tax=Flintibacter muris TaxID=2941327 RepID=UPI00203DA29D|nr:SLOG family protein [Flintibacter muris]